MGARVGRSESARTVRDIPATRTVEFYKTLFLVLVVLETSVLKRQVATQLFNEISPLFHQQAWRHCNLLNTGVTPAIVIKSVHVTLVEQTDLSQCELKPDPRHPWIRLRKGAIDGNMSIAHLSKL